MFRILLVRLLERGYHGLEGFVSPGRLIGTQRTVRSEPGNSLASASSGILPMLPSGVKWQTPPPEEHLSIPISDRNAPTPLFFFFSSSNVTMQLPSRQAPLAQTSFRRRDTDMIQDYHTGAYGTGLSNNGIHRAQGKTFTPFPFFFFFLPFPDAPLLPPPPIIPKGGRVALIMFANGPAPPSDTS